MILQISSTGRVALTKEIMDHLGVKPGDELELELLPGRQAGNDTRRQPKRDCQKTVI